MNAPRNYGFICRRPGIGDDCHIDDTQQAPRNPAPVRPLVIGVDPGPTPGIALRRPDGTFELLQVSAGTLLVVVRVLVEGAPIGAYGGRAAVLAVEKFVVGRRATRSATPAAGAVTRNMVGALEALAVELGIPVFLRSASQVKPWSTDARLDAAGALVKGMPHARDAARHALFCSVHDTGAPDPLSSTRRSPSRCP